MTTSLREEHQASTPDRGAHRRGFSAVDTVERAGVPLLAVLALVVFAVLPASSGPFLSSVNLNNVLAGDAVTAMVAIAMIVPLAAGYFDLSSAAIASAANVACAALIGTHGWPIWAGILVPVVLAAVLGATNGFLVAGLRLDGFIVTLGTYTLLIGLIDLYTNGQTIINGISDSFGSWGGDKLLGLPQAFLLLMATAIIVWYLLMQVPFGRYLEAIGSNEPAARLVGINMRRSIWVSFVVSGTLAGAAGVLQTAQFGGADPTMARGLLFPALTGVFLGATMLRPGIYNVFGTVIGVYFVAFSVNGFVLLGAQDWVQSVFNGAALVLAVALATFMGRRRERIATPAVHEIPSVGRPEPSSGPPPAAGVAD